VTEERTRPTALDLRSEISQASAERATVRGYDLTDLIGELTYTEMVLLAVTGKRPSPAVTKVVDAVFVSFVDHGFLPGALATRVTYQMSPDHLQGALAAGMLSTATAILRTMEDCARLLSVVSGDIQGGGEPKAVVEQQLRHLLNQGKRIPAVGHGLHKEGDPRAVKLLAIARRENVAIQEVSCLELIVEIAESLTGRRLPANVAGAIAAVLLGVGIPWNLQRGFALISRTGGLVAHIGEEISAPVMPEIRRALRDASRIDD
jgi:citrate synthase